MKKFCIDLNLLRTVKVYYDSSLLFLFPTCNADLSLLVLFYGF